MGLRKWWQDLFKQQEPRPNINKTQRRRYVEDVKIGQCIWVEWYKIKGRLGELKCLNNDPLTRKILLEVKWNNGEGKQSTFQRVIFDYDGDELKNFHLLNPIKEKQTEDIDDNDIASLQKRMNDALEKEEYEIAREIQDKIDKLLKK